MFTSFPLLLASAAQALPTPDPLTQDLRCLIVVSVMVEEVPSEQRAEMLGGALYYLGRVNGRAPTLDIEQHMIAQGNALSRMDQQEIAALGQQCGQEIERRGREMEAAGRAMEEMERRRTQ